MSTKNILTSPGVHAASYFMLAGVTQSAVGRRLRLDDSLFTEHLNIGILPWAILITDTCRTLWNQQPQPEQHRVSKALIGASMAATSFGALLAIASKQVWIEYHGWGWQNYAPQEIGQALLFFALGHAAVAYNEEMLFRGHGLDVLTQAVGPIVANGVLIPFFIYFHTPFSNRWLSIVAYGTAGWNYIMMRILSEGLTMPMAYHFTWNWLQNAVFSTHTDMPSLVPISINGSELWTGKFGEPRPGLLMIIVQSILSIILTWLGWKTYQRRRAE